MMSSNRVRLARYMVMSLGQPNLERQHRRYRGIGYLSRPQCLWPLGKLAGNRPSRPEWPLTAHGMADIDVEGGAIMVFTKTFLDGAFSHGFPQPFGYGAISFHD